MGPIGEAPPGGPPSGPPCPVGELALLVAGGGLVAVVVVEEVEVPLLPFTTGLPRV